MATNHISIQALDLQALMDSIKELSERDVLVGIPESAGAHHVEGQQDPITNAAIGYISEYGSAAKNIPARPWLIPGILNAEDNINNSLEYAAKGAIDGQFDKVSTGLTEAGLIAQNSVKATIGHGIPPALSKKTLLARAAKGRKGAQIEMNRRDSGLEPSTEFAIPLIDTGEFRNSVTFVVRKK